MNQRYTHLTVDERYQVKAYEKVGSSNREIALELDGRKHDQSRAQA